MSAISNIDRDSLNVHFTALHQDALEIDFNLLYTLLKRNRQSQSGTKYYQRISMAFQCMRKGPKIKILINNEIDEGHNGVLQWYSNICSFRESYVDLKKRIQQQVDDNHKKRKREEIFWEFTKESSKKVDLSSKDTLIDEIEQLVFDHNLNVVSFFDAISNRLEEILRRIEYAASAMFPELARGFFLPFGTVAIGSLARIRTLLLLFCNEVVHETESSNLILTYSIKNQLIEEQEKSVYQSKMKLLNLEEQSNQSSKWDPLGSTLSRKERSIATLHSLGLHGFYDVENRRAKPSTEIVEATHKGLDFTALNVLLNDNVKDTEDMATIRGLKNDNHDDDLGKTLAPRKTDNTDEIPLPIESKGILRHELDRNEAILESLNNNNGKRSKNESETKKKRSKSKEATKNEETSVPNKKKKEKSKNKKGPDFFDSLFG